LRLVADHHDVDGIARLEALPGREVVGIDVLEAFVTHAGESPFDLLRLRDVRSPGEILLRRNGVLRELGGHLAGRLLAERHRLGYALEIRRTDRAHLDVDAHVAGFEACKL